jgi:hypothetical protein
MKKQQTNGVVFVEGWCYHLYHTVFVVLICYFRPRRHTVVPCADNYWHTSFNNKNHFCANIVYGPGYRDRNNRCSLAGTAFCQKRITMGHLTGRLPAACR